ncbi:MAG: carbamoyltransferase HypF, partial [Veillonella sp.]|nr:carbamoyltransferase HypF [Veillonella sp.]
KKRPHKPLALMAGSLEAAQAVAHISDKERALLESPARPIVLLQAKKGTSLPLDVLAPGTHYIGIMLPYAPIHEVFLPSNALWVMTSGNRSGDPVLFRDQEAQDDLLAIADAFLIHNRRIEAPVDDSVVTQSSQGPLLYRRSRGFVPEPIYVPTLKERNLLAMGSDLKNAFAMNCGSQVLMGPHMGDLASPRSHEGLEWTVDHYQSLFNVQPEGVVLDLHPGYFSSQLGRRLGQEWQVPVLEVQHHHAHIAAVMAEHNCQEKVLGICFDGTGYGTDGSLWGGEFLVCQGGDFYRAAHLAPVPLLGGELAVKEPWRQALWYLTQTYGLSTADWPRAYQEWTKTLPAGWEFLLQASQSDMDFVQSSGAGRLFDAVGSLLGAGNVHSFDGQIAMSLEQLAMEEKGTLLDFHYEEGVLDLLPTVQALVESRAQGTSRKRLAATFHRSLAFAMAEVAESICDQYGIVQVVLAGGVFQNRRLLEEFTKLWDRKPVLMNHKVPPNDGGLALGQLYIAHQRWKEGSTNA